MSLNVKHFLLECAAFNSIHHNYTISKVKEFFKNCQYVTHHRIFKKI